MDGPVPSPMRTATVELDADLLEKAEALGINPTRLLDHALRREIGRHDPGFDQAMRESAEIWADFHRRYGSAMDDFRDP